MARNITQYDLLISCPGDAEASVKIIKDVIEEFNQQFSDTLGINIRWRYWKDSVYSESGGKPQDLLNAQIVDSSDLAVAVFKNRFGSPTDKYTSGTEEEIERMLSDGRQVFLFFDESPVIMSDVDINEYEKVQEFKRKYKDKGIFWTFNNEDEFRSLFRAHITRFFMTLSNTEVSEGKSDLVIRSYRLGKMEETVQLSPFDMGGLISSEKLKNRIQDLIKQINEMTLVKSSSSVQSALDFFGSKKVEIEKGTIDIISTVAEKLNLVLEEEFFDLGNLTESTGLSASPFVGRDLNGTKEEIAKYYAICSLEDIIYKTIGHLQMEHYYKDLYGVALILCNDGTKFDEDIDIEIVLPRDRFIGIDELSVPSEEVNLGDDLCFEDVFTIPATKDYISYCDTKKSLTGATDNRFTTENPFYKRDFEEEYRDALKDIFEYQIFTNDKDLIIRVHFDYIKQHQSAAFPTWLFIKNPDEGLSMKYSITTKNNKNVIERQLDFISFCSEKKYGDI